MSKMNLQGLFNASNTDAAICCFCGSPDKNHVTTKNGVLVTVALGDQEQWFAAHQTCLVGVLVNPARTGPVAGLLAKNVEM